MTIKRLLPVSLILGLCIFSSCSKDMDEVNPALDASATDAKKETQKPTDPGPADANLVFTVPSPVMKDKETTVTLTATSATSGEIRIERGMDDDGNYTTHEEATNWVIVTKQDVSVSNTTSYKFTPDAAGLFGFRGKYIPKGGSGFLAKDQLLNMEVIEECPATTLTGIVTRDITITNLAEGEHQFKATFTIKACSDITNAKLQGGLTAKVNFVGKIETSPETENIRETNQNFVINWDNINLKRGETGVYTITFRKKVSGSGPHTLTGDWSLEENGVKLLTVTPDPVSW